MNRQKVVVFVSVLALVVGLLSVFAFAAVDESFSVPYYGATGAPYDIGLHLGYDNDGNYFSYFVESASSSSSIFLVAIYSNGSAYSVVGITNDTAAIYTNGRYTYNSNTGTYSFAGRSNQLRLDRGSQVVIDGLTYYTASSNTFLSGGVTLTYPHVYSSYDDAYNALLSALNYTPPAPEFPGTYSFSIPAGYVAYIEYASTGSADLDITCQMPELSTAWIAGPEPSFWPSDLTYFGVADDLPANGDFVPYLSWTDIRWSRGEDRNILGQTKTAVYSNEFTKTTHNYLTIFNFPYFIQDLSDGDTTLSPTIFGTVTNVLSVTVFETRNVESGGTYGFEIISNDIDVSEDGTWTDGEGNFVEPNPGGGNYKPSDSDINSVLDKLVQDIDSFFSGTWRHIRQMITSAGKLPSVIVELYSWLPEEYKAVIFSAFGIVMVVAVLKVML